jgi:REP element-mobilizing transposase RayT
VVLPLTRRYHFVFTKLTPVQGHLLGLALPLQTPLVHIRQEITDLLHLIHEIEVQQLNDDPGLEQSLQLNTQSTSSPDLPPDSKAVLDGWQMEIDAPGQLKDEPVPEQSIAEPGSEEDQTNGALPHAASFDPPIQPEDDRDADSGKVNDAGTQDPDPRWQSLDVLVPPEPITDPDYLRFSDGLESPIDQQIADRRPPSWQSLEEGEDLASILQEDFAIDQEQPNVEEQFRDKVSAPEKPTNAASPGDQEATKPVAQKAPQPSLADTVFDTTFYLVPRVNHHYILGELAHRLRVWLPKLCEVYGWQLDLLSVRPDYLKWTLRDFPECLTREMLGILRRVTSEQIFKVFPALLAGNPTQDFWSPGYLVDTQYREFPTQVLIATVSKDRCH